MLYMYIVAACGAVISVVVTLVTKLNFFYVSLFTMLAILAVVLVDGAVATVARLLPKGCANHESKVYVVSKEEKKFYENIKIRKWKDKIPEMGHFTGFRKNKLADPKSLEYVERFLLESCYGEIGHFFSCFVGFVILLFYPISEIWLAVSIPVAIINIFMNLPSLLILRYNSYKLRVLRNSLEKKKNRAKQAEQEEAKDETKEDPQTLAEN